MPTIRRATTTDAAAIAAIYGPYCEGTFISFEETAPSVDEMARRIASIGATRPWIVLESACGPSEREGASESEWGCPPSLVAEQAGDQLRRGLAIARMDCRRGGGGPQAQQRMLTEGL